MAKQPAASTTRSNGPAKLPALPEQKPETVASANVPPAQVDVRIGQPTVAPQESAVVKTASTDFLGAVRDHVGQMRSAAYTTTRKSIKEAVFVAATGLPEKTPGVPITEGGWH